MFGMLYQYDVIKIVSSTSRLTGNQSFSSSVFKFIIVPVNTPAFFSFGVTLHIGITTINSAAGHYCFALYQCLIMTVLTDR